MVPCLNQRNVYIKRKLRVWRVQKCISLVGAKTSLTCAVLQTTLSHISQYQAEQGNLQKTGSIFCHGTVFELTQCLYQKEAMDMESPKMHSSSQCKNLTYLCGTANDPVSSRPVEGRERKFAEFWVYLLPWYHICTKAMFILKGSYGSGQSKLVFLSSVEKPHLPVRDCKRLCLK